MTKETLFYTVIEQDGKEKRIYFEEKRDDVKFQFPLFTHISRQQLCELGWLFISLAGKEVDHESAAAVVEGYQLTVPEPLKELVDWD